MLRWIIAVVPSLWRVSSFLVVDGRCGERLDVNNTFLCLNAINNWPNADMLQDAFGV